MLFSTSSSPNIFCFGSILDKIFLIIDLSNDNTLEISCRIMSNPNLKFCSNLKIIFKIKNFESDHLI